MNEFARPLKHHGTTQAADGLPRLRWSLEEFERLSELGFFGGIDRERERLELVEGELVPMHAKGSRHEWVRAEIMDHLMRQIPVDCRLLIEPGWRPDKDQDLYLEPDMIVCRKGSEPSKVAPSDVLLLIEVADTSLKYDGGLKARVYATLGVREYWVIDAKTLEARVHLEPGQAGYARVTAVAKDAMLTPTLLPALGVTLGSLALG